VSNQIAFFDFDGTITTKDTLLEFIKFAKGRFRFYVGFFVCLPYLVAYKLKIISNQRAKEKVLNFFFRRTSVEIFKRDCKLFSKDVLPTLIRPKALEEIAQLQQEGFMVVVVSASPENWICYWAEEMKVKLIASRLEIFNNNITGKLVGRNCHGQEKVRRIAELYALADYEKVFAYGDSKGDKPMLQLATQKNYKPFRN
jgi:HAD superfamily hydrolase (TIGR01490 family)